MNTDYKNAARRHYDDPVSNSEIFNENSVLEAYGPFLKEITFLTLGE